LYQKEGKKDERWMSRALAACDPVQAESLVEAVTILSRIQDACMRLRSNTL
jgi:hypothetical protein